MLPQYSGDKGTEGDGLCGNNNEGNGNGRSDQPRLGPLFFLCISSRGVKMIQKEDTAYRPFTKVFQDWMLVHSPQTLY
jgi:uncharacterized spore protein YtfJ